MFQIVSNSIQYYSSFYPSKIHLKINNRPDIQHSNFLQYHSNNSSKVFHACSIPSLLITRYYDPFMLARIKLADRSNSFLGRISWRQLIVAQVRKSGCTFSSTPVNVTTVLHHVSGPVGPFFTAEIPLTSPTIVPRNSRPAHNFPWCLLATLCALSLLPQTPFPAPPTFYSRKNFYR